MTQTTLRLGVDARAIVVPATAVQNGQQGQYVYVVGDDQTVAMRPVKVARTNGDDAVIADGRQAGRRRRHRRSAAADAGRPRVGQTAAGGGGVR